MQDRTPSDLASFRLQQAAECLQVAERELIAGSYKTSANRSYYCIFHAMRAILALERFDSKKHSGVIARFRQNYIKTGIFPAEHSDFIKDAFEIRGDSDYQDFYVVSRDDVAAQIENAREFLKAVEDYVNKRTGE